MNAKFEWFGWSVARKHVYFYTFLVAASVVANTVKDQMFGGESAQAEQAIAQISQVHNQMAEAEAIWLRK